MDHCRVLNSDYRFSCSVQQLNTKTVTNMCGPSYPDTFKSSGQFGVPSDNKIEDIFLSLPGICHTLYLDGQIIIVMLLCMIKEDFLNLLKCFPWENRCGECLRDFYAVVCRCSATGSLQSGNCYERMTLQRALEDNLRNKTYKLSSLLSNLKKMCLQ